MVHSSETAVILSNAGAPVSVNAGGSSQWLGWAETLLLPAALGQVEIRGPADVLIGYLPDLERDVREPLTKAGYTGPRSSRRWARVSKGKQIPPARTSTRRGVRVPEHLKRMTCDAVRLHDDPALCALGIRRLGDDGMRMPRI